MKASDIKDFDFKNVASGVESLKRQEETVKHVTQMSVLTEMAEGNPGALTFLLECIQFLEYGYFILPRLYQLEITGTDLYVLYSDICGRDLNRVDNLLRGDCPDDLLKDACSRQDYSGRELLKEYL